MTVEIFSKRKKNLPVGEKVIVVDVTKNGTDPTFVKFSPFCPHGDIPVPGFADLTTTSVEGAWQGLKAFEREGPDRSYLKKTLPKKRPATEAKGRVLGHRYGEGDDARLLGYVDARKMIYVPMYEHVIQTRLANEVALLKGLVREGNRVVLLDYETNEDVENTTRPLSHASILKRWIES